MHTFTNDLINETSPYLQQHAHNPVDWHAWNKTNLEEAKSLGKPILISIGYSSCHWCHVMEHESFEDEDVAAYMNAHFYCIKVDREERPDVDQIYMTAANIITGSGGWPLNCFALPDGRPFHAGTYFPKDAWMQTLKNVDQQFKTNYEKIEDYAQRLTTGIRMQETAISDSKTSKLDAELIEQAVRMWQSNWDMKEGGTQRVPKFPMPSNYEFLLKWNLFNEDEMTDSFIHLSLTKMAYGGIFDQIGGGFSRYSTDAIWKAPHFEKMLYDNAQLLKVYAMAYAQTKNPLYKEVLDKTKLWLKREMLHNSGLFYSALDADSEGEEGKFYVWTEKEIETLLPKDFDLVKVYYQLGGKGLWEHENNILVREQSQEEIAQLFGISVDEVVSKIDKANQLLLKARNSRIRPGLDDKCLSSWNGLMLEGLAEAYKATGDDEYKDLAINCADALLKFQITTDGIFHSFKEGKSTIDGMLEDYAFVGLGLLSVFEIADDPKYYKTALKLSNLAVKDFYDNEKSLFYFNKENELILRTAEIYDNVIPSTNSAMVHLLIKLGLLEGLPNYLQIAENLVGKVQDKTSEYPSGHAYWSIANTMFTQSYYEIAIVGKNAGQLKIQLFEKGITNAMVVSSEKESDLPIFKDRFKTGETHIYVCQNGICALPVKTVDEAMVILNGK